MLERTVQYRSLLPTQSYRRGVFGPFWEQTTVPIRYLRCQWLGESRQSYGRDVSVTVSGKNARGD